MKVIKPMHGKPMIVHMLDRLKLSNVLDDIIICTSKEKQDDPLANIADKEGVKCYRGSADDVIARLMGAADKYKVDYIVNITADCPFVDHEYINYIVDCYKETNADLIRAWDLPHGAFSYGIKTDALREVIKLKATNDTEVWYQYFVDTNKFNVVDLDILNPFHKRPGLRMTLDYPEDWQFFEAIFDEIYKENEVFSLDSILTLLDNKPEIVNLNKGCSRKFYKRYDRQSTTKLKKKQSVKKALVIGCGSIGQRHIRNLKAIGINNIIALRSKKGYFKKLPKDLGVVEINAWSDVLTEKPDIAIVSNPTSFHLKTVIRLLPLVKGVLIEKPLSDSMSGIDELIFKAKKYNTVLFVGHNLMFHPIIESMHKFINAFDLGNIINIQCQFGQWLPDWHPYENYKKAYYARDDLGGGVSLTLIHEIHMAIDLAGDPSEVFGIVSESELLDLDVDVISDVMVKHKSGCVSQIHLDYLQKPSHRSGLVSYERGWISYDYTENRIIGQNSTDNVPKILWSNDKYDANDMYLKEVKCFVGYVEECRVKNSFDIESAIESLKLVEALFKSNKEKRVISIPYNKRFEF
jgi:spore coat polysaccharide biosynthesis protein SpsF (cytidylyltransferase family)/predicted dehydrogenase